MYTVLFIVIELAIFLLGVAVGRKFFQPQETYVIPCPDDLDEEKLREMFEHIMEDLHKNQ